MNERDSLRRLARLYGVLTKFSDGFGVEREASAETLIAVLRELGAEIETAAEAPEAIRARRRGVWSEPLEPTSVVWQGRPAQVRVCLPGGATPLRARWEIDFEDGGRRAGVAEAAAFRPSARVEVEGQPYVASNLALPGDLPAGRHRLRIEAPGLSAEAFLIVAPTQCFSPQARNPIWGVFLPLYALHSKRSPAMGDFSDLAELMAWARRLGGSVVATLPLLAAYLDQPFEPSPYAPVSRRFWNELYVDPRQAPEWERSIEARRSFESAAPLSGGDYVNYRAAAANKRRVLEVLAQTAGPKKLPAKSELENYARFRATVERRGETWEHWPASMREGRLRPRDFDANARDYHVYVQRLAELQLTRLAENAGSPGLYLDLPLGANRSGYDVWREPEAFAQGVSGGAPPDRFFTKGQDWGFAPLHPEHVRRQGHSHYIACLRHHLGHAGMLRIDHFMGVHRLYWIPRGARADEGTYVRYPAEELYAVLCLESQRAQTRIIGEDLGTVPESMRDRMRDHAIGRSYVAQFNFSENLYNALPLPERGMTATVNTHDTPTFASFWNALEAADLLDLGLLDEAGAADTRESRARLRKLLGEYFGTGVDGLAALRACLRRLARSDSDTLLVNLEDLWGETRPQNTPGTYEERANWKLRAGLDLESMKEDERVVGALAEVDAERKRSAEIGRLRSQHPKGRDL